MFLVTTGQCYTTKFCVQTGQSASEALNVLKKTAYNNVIVGILDFKQFHKTLTLNQEEA